MTRLGWDVTVVTDTSFDDFAVKRSIDKAQRLMLVQHVEPISAINLARGSAQLWLSKQCH